MRKPYKHTIERITNFLPHAYFLYYFILSVHYYLEKASFSDNSYFLFSIIQEESFAIYHQRWIGLLTQVVPLTLVKIGMSVKSIAIGYSINLALIYYIFFLIFYHVLNKKIFALIFLFITGVLHHYSFYWLVSELNIGMPFFIAFIWLLSTSTNSEIDSKFTMTSAILSVLLFFIHPFLSILFPVYLFLFYIERKNIKWVIATIIAIIAVGLKYKFLSGFEKGKVSSMAFDTFSIEAIKSSYLYYAFKEFGRNQFYFVKLLYVLILLLLIYKRKVLLVASIIASAICTYLAIHYYLPNGELVSYMETYLIYIFLPLFVLAFIWGQNNLLKHQGLIILGITLLASYSLFQTKSDSLFKNRLKYIESTLHGKEGLYYANNGDMDNSILMATWALPYETLLVSTINENSSSIYHNDRKIEFSEVTDSNLFIGFDPSKDIKLTMLNNKYFKFPYQTYKKLD